MRSGKSRLRIVFPPVAWLILSPFAVTPLRADLTISEITLGEAGGRQVAGVRVTMIKGLKMRIDVKQGQRTNLTAAIYDAEAGKIVSLKPENREAQVRTFDALQAAAERTIPRQSVVSSIAPTSRREDVLGKSCDEHEFTIRIPIASSGTPVLMMAGKTCVLKGFPGADEYTHFAAAAARKGLILGFTSANLVFVALARAQTELYRIVAELGGIPVKTQSDIHFEGGILATLLNKSAGSRKSVVTQMSLDPLPKGEFDVPPGWRSTEK